MSIWSVASIEERPVVTLRDWMVYETQTGERHFVGLCLESGSGRVSSAIRTFDLETRAGKTRSGRQYVLWKRPGYNKHAQYVWGAWMAINGVTESRDVSAEYMPPPDTGSSLPANARPRKRGRRK